MKKIHEKLSQLMAGIEENKTGYSIWGFAFAGIMMVRTVIKNFLAAKNPTLRGVMTDYLHELLFFLILFLMLWALTSLILRINPKKLAIYFLWGAWLFIFPPLIDMAKTGGSIFWSFYLIGPPAELWGEFTSFFGNLPTGIVYFGTRIVILLALISIFTLVYLKSLNIKKALISLIFAYCIMFLMGAFPTVITYLAHLFDPLKSVQGIGSAEVLRFTGSPKPIFGLSFSSLSYSMAYNLNLAFYPLLMALLAGVFFFSQRDQFMAVVRNARWPQLFYHGGLLFIGLGLGYLAYPENFWLNTYSVTAVINVIIAIGLSWIASVIINDIYDFGIDSISNPDRPLQKKIFTVQEYADLGVLIFSLSILGGLVIDLKFAVMFLLYQFFAWSYSAEPFRLKKIPVIATTVSSIASLIILFIGFVIFSGDHNLRGLSPRIIFLILIALTLSLPIKDFKDIEGDKKYRIWTIPVLFGESTGRLIIATGVFISFVLSVFFLNEFRLFWWAIAFGGMAFMAITSEQIKKQHLLWWVLLPVFVYGLVLTDTIFL